MKALRFLVVAVFVMNTSIAAQWLKHPTADIPRTADGKPDLTAPTPRQANGKPGAGRPVASGAGPRRRHDARHEGGRGRPVPAVGRGALQGAAREQQPRRSDGHAASSAACRDRTSSATRSRFSSGRRWSSSCTRRCTRIGRSSQTGARSPKDPNPALVRLLGGALGWRRPGRRIERLQRQRLAGQRRAARRPRC